MQEILKNHSLSTFYEMNSNAVNVIPASYIAILFFNSLITFNIYLLHAILIYVYDIKS